MQMLMQRVEETPTCEICGTTLDEERDTVKTCRDCEDKAKHKELQKEESQDYAARRSQYSYLVHEAVMKANEIVIQPNGDWHVKDR